MLPRLMMLPLPRAAIFGASAATRKYAARTLAAKSRSKVRGRPEPGEPGVVDQHVDRARLLGEVVHLGRAGEVGRHEAGLTAHRGDRAGHREAAIGVPPVHDVSAPCRPSSSAAALPMPEVAPVIRALMPSRSRWSFISRPSDRRTSSCRE